MSISKKEKSEAKFLKEMASFRVPQSVTDAAIRLYLESLDCSQARLVQHLYKSRTASSHGAIARLKIDPDNYGTAEEFESAYLATEFLRKYKDLKTGTDTRAVAMESLRETEEVCCATNRRFLDLASSGEFSGANVPLLDSVVRIVGQILGKFDVDRVLELCAWGPGATFEIKGENTSSSNKFQHGVGITKDCYQLWGRVLKAAYPSWWGHLIDAGFPTFNLGNRVTTVDKDAEKDRTISIEPDLNSWFQKGIGSFMQELLIPWGVDLRDQTPNQRSARKGSVDGTIATIDLKNASNTIAYFVVMALLQKSGNWFAILDATRSPLGLIDDAWKEWEMFSCMGNGFTFPLQTIIFLACALAVCEHLGISSEEVVVYGDDILLPTGAVSLFTSFTAFLGFAVNTKKTHVSGNFRESCGAHWWRGVDVKPILLKERLSNVNDVFKLANAIRRLGHRRISIGCDHRLKRAWLLLFNCVPEKYRFVIAEGYGDGGFIGNFDEARPSYKRTKATPYTKLAMVEGCHVRQVIERGVNATGFEHIGQLLAALARVKATQTITFHVRGTGNSPLRIPVRTWPRYHPERNWPLSDVAEIHGGFASDMPAFGNEAPLRRVTELAFNELLVHDWYNLGPWI